MGRGHQHLCFCCPDLLLRGLERGQDSKDDTDIHGHIRDPMSKKGPHLKPISLVVKRLRISGMNSINSGESGKALETPS